jgi:hypothetical protein
VRPDVMGCIVAFSAPLYREGALHAECASVRPAARPYSAIALKQNPQPVEREHVVDFGDVFGVFRDQMRHDAAGDPPAPPQCRRSNFRLAGNTSGTPAYTAQF